MGLVAGKAHIRDRKPKCVVRRLKHLASRSIIVKQVLPHSDSLAALSREYVCDLSHRSQISNFKLEISNSKPDHRSAPCHPTAECSQQYQASFLNAAGFYSFVECDRYRRRRCVAMFGDIRIDLFFRHTEP